MGSHGLMWLMCAEALKKVMESMGIAAACSGGNYMPTPKSLVLFAEPWPVRVSASTCHSMVGKVRAHRNGAWIVDSHASRP